MRVTKAFGMGGIVLALVLGAVDVGLTCEHDHGPPPPVPREPPPPPPPPDEPDTVEVVM